MSYFSFNCRNTLLVALTISTSLSSAYGSRDLDAPGAPVVAAPVAPRHAYLARVPTEQQLKFMDIVREIVEETPRKGIIEGQEVNGRQAIFRCIQNGQLTLELIQEAKDTLLNINSIAERCRIIQSINEGAVSGKMTSPSPDVAKSSHPYSSATIKPKLQLPSFGMPASPVPKPSADPIKPGLVLPSFGRPEAPAPAKVAAINKPVVPAPQVQQPKPQPVKPAPLPPKPKTYEHLGLHQSVMKILDNEILEVLDTQSSKYFNSANRNALSDSSRAFLEKWSYSKLALRHQLDVIHKALSGRMKALTKSKDEQDAHDSIIRDNGHKVERRDDTYAAQMAYLTDLSRAVDAIRNDFDHFGENFLKLLFKSARFEELSQRMPEHFTKDVCNKIADSLTKLMSNVLRCDETISAMILLEWYVHILPSLNKTMDWFRKIEREGYNSVMNEALKNCPNNAIIRERIQAFRVPVVEASRYLGDYTVQLLDYISSDKEINPKSVFQSNVFAIKEMQDALIALRNSNDPDVKLGAQAQLVSRFKQILIPTGNIGFSAHNTIIHPEFTTDSWSPVFSYGHFIDVMEGFAMTFINAYNEYKKAGVLDHFYNRIMSSNNGECLNGRAANLQESVLNDSALRASNSNNVETSQLVTDLLQKWYEDDSLESRDLSHDLLNEFKVGTSKPICGANGPVTEKIIKQVILDWVKKFGGDRYMAQITDRSYKWAKGE